jgi:hypothetical protein
MSVSASKGNKRTMVYWELKKASQAIERALDSLATIQDGLAALNKALKHVLAAGQAAEATTLAWEDEKGKKKVKVKRDALPAAIRRSIACEQAHLEKLLARVKAIPVTKDQVLAAKAEKAKRKAK